MQCRLSPWVALLQAGLTSGCRWDSDLVAHRFFEAQEEVETWEILLVEMP